MDRPDISYPVTWEYRVIGTDHWALTSHIAYVMGTSNYTLRDSNKSSGGTYLSIRVSLIVANEKERLDIFTRLKDSPAVKMVL